MSDLTVRLDEKEFRDWMAKARRELSPVSQDTIVEKSAWETRTGLIDATPHKSGGTAGAWTVTGSHGERRVINSSPVMRYLNDGTPRKNPGSKIYPRHGKALAIPKVAEGRATSMSQTVRDKSKRAPGSESKFTFVRWVHGIKPMRIVEKYIPEAGRILVNSVKEVFARL